MVGQNGKINKEKRLTNYLENKMGQRGWEDIYVINDSLWQ